MLAGKRVLIVLDDAAGADQVRPLIPGDRGCCVLITSRALLTGLAGAHHIGLDVLSADDSTRLFAQMVGEARAAAEPEATADVLAACAGLPLAIRIAGSRLASRPQWTIRHLADRLADEHSRLAELAIGDVAVRASFQLSYANLETRPEHKRLEPARAFRLLGLVSGPDIGLPAAAALIERPTTDAENALELLVDTHLLGTSVPGRYQFHDLIRIVAAERAVEEETERQRVAALRRLLTWYLHTVHGAAPLISPLLASPPLDHPNPAVPPLAFADRDAAVSWCDTELANLVAAAHTAAGIGLHDVVVDLATALRAYFYLRKPRHDWVATLRLGVESAQALGDPDGEFRMASNLGIAYYQIQRSAEAIDTLQEVLRMAGELGYAERESATLGNLATCYSVLGRYDEAVDHQQRALVIARRLGNRDHESVHVNNLGEHYRGLGQLEKSLSHLQEALTIKQELGDDYTTGSTLDGLAVTYLAMARYEEAADHAQRAVTLRTTLDDRWGMAESQDRLATALDALGRHAEARHHWQAALAGYEALGSTEATRIRAHLTNRNQA